MESEIIDNKKRKFKNTSNINMKNFLGDKD
jgi:hypothetical protein